MPPPTWKKNNDKKKGKADKKRAKLIFTCQYCGRKYRFVPTTGWTTHRPPPNPSRPQRPVNYSELFFLVVIFISASLISNPVYLLLQFYILPLPWKDLFSLQRQNVFWFFETEQYNIPFLFCFFCFVFTFICKDAG